MHRRARHLNAKAAGAGLVLDARRISGLNDGDAVSTWNDVSGNGNNGTQADAAKKPLYNVNQFGGSPGILFDGTDDWVSCGTGTSLDVHLSSFILICIAKLTGDGPCLAKTRAAGQAHRYYIGRYLSKFEAFYQPASGAIPYPAGQTDARTTAVLHSVICNRSSGNLYGRTNGLQYGSASFTADIGTNGTNPNRFLVGAYGNSTDTGEAANFFANGHIGYASFVACSASLSLAKRLEHSAGFSFKIQCS